MESDNVVNAVVVMVTVVTRPFGATASTVTAPLGAAAILGAVISKAGDVVGIVVWVVVVPVTVVAVVVVNVSVEVDVKVVVVVVLALPTHTTMKKMEQIDASTTTPMASAAIPATCGVQILERTSWTLGSGDASLYLVFVIGLDMALCIVTVCGEPPDLLDCISRGL